MAFGISSFVARPHVPNNNLTCWTTAPRVPSLVKRATLTMTAKAKQGDDEGDGEIEISKSHALKLVNSALLAGAAATLRHCDDLKGTLDAYQTLKNCPCVLNGVCQRGDCIDECLLLKQQLPEEDRILQKCDSVECLSPKKCYKQQGCLRKMERQTKSFNVWVGWFGAMAILAIVFVIGKDVKRFILFRGMERSGMDWYGKKFAEFSDTLFDFGKQLEKYMPNKLVEFLGRFNISSHEFLASAGWFITFIILSILLEMGKHMFGISFFEFVRMVYNEWITSFLAAVRRLFVRCLAFVRRFISFRCLYSS